MTSPIYCLAVTSEPIKSRSKVALIGRDIRSKPEEIARHCLTQHRGVMEDVATIAESIALADRLFPRQRGKLWARVINCRFRCSS